MVPSWGWHCPRGDISHVWRHLWLSLLGGSAAAIHWGEASAAKHRTAPQGQDDGAKAEEPCPAGQGDLEGALSSSVKAGINPALPTRFRCAAATVYWLTPHPFPSPLLCLLHHKGWESKEPRFPDSFAARDGQVTPFRPMRQKGKSTQGFWESVDFLIKGTMAGHGPLFCPLQT